MSEHQAHGRAFQVGDRVLVTGGYQNDPEWMQNNLPDLFAWFETVKKTGSPPTP